MIELKDCVEIISHNLRSLNDIPHRLNEIDDETERYFNHIIDMLITLNDCVVLEYLSQDLIDQYTREYNQSVSIIALSSSDQYLIEETFKYIKMKIENIIEDALHYECYEVISNIKKIINYKNVHINFTF